MARETIAKSGCEPPPEYAQKLGGNLAVESAVSTVEAGAAAAPLIRKSTAVSQPPFTYHVS